MYWYCEGSCKNAALTWVGVAGTEFESCMGREKITKRDHIETEIE